MNRRLVKYGADRQYGTVSVETAIMLPVLLLLMMGTGEVGRAFFQYNTLVKSVRDASRHLANHAQVGSTGNIDTTQTMGSGLTLETEARNLARFGDVLGNGALLLPGYTAGMINITVPDADNVSVTTAYTYQPVLFTMLDLGFGGGVDLTGYTLRSSLTTRAL